MGILVQTGNLFLLYFSGILVASSSLFILFFLLEKKRYEKDKQNKLLELEQVLINQSKEKVLEYIGNLRYHIININLEKDNEEFYGKLEIAEKNYKNKQRW